MIKGILRKLNPYEKQIRAARSKGTTYICPKCDEWLYSDELSRELHLPNCNSLGLSIN